MPQWVLHLTWIERPWWAMGGTRECTKEIVSPPNISEEAALKVFRVCQEAGKGKVNIRLEEVEE